MAKEEKIQIYEYDKNIKSILKRLEEDNDVLSNNKKHILKFYEYCSAEGLSKARLEFYLNRFLVIGRLAKKDFEKMDKEDLIFLVNKINNLKLADRTKEDYRGSLKKFFKWLRGISESGVYPAEVRWIKNNYKSNSHLLPEELLNEDDIKKMVNAAEHMRNKALIFILYESGCRIGELLSLRIKHVAFDNFGAIIIVNGKTGMRRVRLVGATPYLSAWMSIHPDRDKPESPLWIVIGTTKEIARQNKPGYKFNWSYSLKHAAVIRLLKKTAKRAEIHKRVNPHTFRHSRATQLASKLTEAQMKEYFGWVQGSDMASIYVHMSGRDVDSALLEKVYGLKQETEKKEESKLKPIKCPRCSFINGATAKFCSNCSMALDPVAAMELDNKIKEQDEKLKKLFYLWVGRNEKEAKELANEVGII